MTELTPIEKLQAHIVTLERELEQAGGKAHRRRINRLLAKARTALVAKQQADGAPLAKPEEYVAPVVKSGDERVIPGLTGKGAILRLDTLAKLWEAGKITPAQYSAGRDYLHIVEHYFANTSGFARLSDEPGRVGGDGDPIRRYIKARAARRQLDGTIVGYIPTQRPRNPSYSRPQSDGWTGRKLAALAEFSRVARLVERMDREPRIALSVLVIDHDRPDLPPLSIAAACRRIFKSSRGRNYAILTRWLCTALDELDAEFMAKSRIAA